MSTPVGQSREQPLQDRQRSRASCTSGERQPFDRPAGRQHLLQHAGPAAGGVLLLAGRRPGRAHHAAGALQVGPALAHAGAAVHGGREVAAVVRIGQRQPLPPAGRGGHPDVVVEPGRADQDTGVEHVVRVEQRLDLLERADGGGGVHQRQQLAARPAVAVLARQRAAVAGDQAGGVLDEGAVGGAAAVRGTGAEREVDPDVHAAVAEVPVRDALQPVPGRAAPRTRAGRRRAARPGRRRPPSRRAPGWPSLVRAASPAPSSRIRQIAAASATSVTTSESSAPESASTPRAVRGHLGDACRRSARRSASPRRGGGPGRSRPARRGAAARSASPGPRRRSARAAAAPASRRRRRPSWGSRARPARGTGASATSRTVAPSTSASVPSLPTSARATSKPRSGSRCSSE